MRGAAAAVVLLMAVAAPAAAQVVRGPVHHVDAPRRPGVTLPAVAGSLLVPWDPMGVLGAPSIAGVSPLEAARAAAGAAAAGPNPSDVILIPALFSDSPEPHLPVSELRRILFDGPVEGGTFVDFYREASRGVANPDGTVTEWVRTGVTMLEAAGSEEGHGWIGPRVDDYVVEAVEAADPVVDFGLFDNDGPDGVPNSGDDDGFVDALVIEHLEVGGNCGGPAIWAHFGSVSAQGQAGWPTDDLRPDGSPIRAYRYLTQGATDCGGVNPQGPGVIAHEYGHLLGLPDIYERWEGIEPWKRHWNVGCFGLMAGGSWGCGTGVREEAFGPVHHSVMMKEWLEWMPIETVGEVVEKEFLLEPAQTTGRGLRIPLRDDGTESLYLEYRPREGFDHWLPVGGVLLYHADFATRERTPPPGHPPVKWYHLIEADGDHALRKIEEIGGNRGVPGDVFGIDGRTGPYSSEPGGPVRLLDHDGMPVPVTLHSIEVMGDVARVVLSTSPTPTLVASEPAGAARALESGTLATFRVAGGALPYSAADTDPDGDFTVTFDGNEGSVVGTPYAVGTVALDFDVVDALGISAPVAIEIEVDDAAVGVEALVSEVVAGVDAAGERAAYLDRQGNRNGRPDVGDLRGWLRRNGGG